MAHAVQALGLPRGVMAANSIDLLIWGKKSWLQAPKPEQAHDVGDLLPAMRQGLSVEASSLVPQDSIVMAQRFPAPASARCPQHAAFEEGVHLRHLKFSRHMPQSTVEHAARAMPALPHHLRAAEVSR